MTMDQPAPTGWNVSDCLAAALVVLPLLGLGGIVTGSAVTWQSQELHLANALGEVIPEGDQNINLAMMAEYDRGTSYQSTAPWKSVLAASESLNRKYGGFMVLQHSENALRSEQIFAPEEAWPAAELASRYAADARPIIERLDSLAGSADPIWVPTIFDGQQTTLYEVQHMREVARMLNYSFASAVHQGDPEHALRLVQVSDRLFGLDQDSVFVIEELVRLACHESMMRLALESIAKNVWTPQQLGELERKITRQRDWDAKWKSVVRAGLLESMSILRSPVTVDASFQDLPALIDLAPSTLVGVADFHRELAAVPEAGTIGHQQQVEQLYQRRVGASGSVQADQLFQFPSLSGLWVTSMAMPSYQGLAATLVRQRQEHQFRQTTLAIRQFRIREDRWPDSLDELDLPPAATTDFRGISLDYRVREGKAILGTYVLGVSEPETITLR